MSTKSFKVSTLFLALSSFLASLDISFVIRFTQRLVPFLILLSFSKSYAKGYLLYALFSTSMALDTRSFLFSGSSLFKASTNLIRSAWLMFTLFEASSSCFHISSEISLESSNPSNPSTLGGDHPPSSNSDISISPSKRASE